MIDSSSSSDRLRGSRVHEPVLGTKWIALKGKEIRAPFRVGRRRRRARVRKPSNTERLNSPTLLTLGLALAACSPGDISTVQPGTGEVRIIRTTLTVHASVDSADAVLGEALGWQAGVPEVEVQILRNGTREWLTARTDSTGTAVFAGLLAGLYRVFGGRTLTEAEAASIDQPIRAFGDGRTLRVFLDTDLELVLLADRPGSLVLSEIGNGNPGYFTGMYFEVYNNADTTIFLDGKMFGSTLVLGKELDWMPCVTSELWRSDPAGVAARFVLQFPGSGTEHPIPPGEVRTVAVSAIDHTTVHPTMLDLSGADFEIGGAGTADNPAVPNMRDVGLEGFRLSRLHATGYHYFLAEPFDISTLPVQYRAFDGRDYRLVPREKLIDVAVLTHIWPDKDVESPPCGLMIHRDFDRYEGGFFEIGFDVDPNAEATRSVERKILRMASDGRMILMNTNTSAVDFFVGTRTPGRLPH